MVCTVGLGQKKRFHSSAFMQDILSTLIGQLMKETLFFPPSQFLLSEFDCILIVAQTTARKFSGVPGTTTTATSGIERKLD